MWIRFAMNGIAWNGIDEEQILSDFNKIWVGMA